MRIELACAECGANRFGFPEASGGDDALVVCEECGHEIGTLGKMKDDVAKTVLSKITPIPGKGRGRS